MTEIQVWAIGRVKADGVREASKEGIEDARKKVYQAIKEGKSRLGMWDQTVSLREKPHGKNKILLRIKEGDWIVHVHYPEYGKCVAVQVTGEYGFDDGIECDHGWGWDFNNYIPVDPNSIVEFHRKDRNVLSSVNLGPRKRCQRVLEVEDFLKSIDNLKSNRYSGKED